jgi:hypothetical protein
MGSPIVSLEDGASFISESPVVINDTVLLPISIISELGLSVYFNPVTQEVTITRDFQSRRLSVQTRGTVNFAYVNPIAIVHGFDNITYLQFSTVAETINAYFWLSGQNNVNWVEPARIVVAESQNTGAFATANTRNLWGIQRTGTATYAQYLRNTGITGSIIVSVIDTGVDPNHHHFSGRLVPGHNFVNNNADTRDIRTHGTHVAGTIIDATPGLNVQIMPMMVFQLHPNGDVLACDILVSLAIRDSADRGARVINLSLGSRNPANISNIRANAISYAVNRNAVVVVAAGNNAGYARSFGMAGRSDVITVAATNQNNRGTSFTNWGSAVDLSAPGYGINSSIPAGRFDYKNGTSMAAPHVTAAVAMYLLRNPTLSPASVQHAFRNYVYIPNGWNSSRYGAGILDMTRAMTVHEVSRTNLNAERWMGSDTQGIPNNYRTIRATPSDSAGSRGLLPFDARIWVTARITMSNGEVWVRFTSNNVNAQNGYIRANHLFDYETRTYLNGDRWVGNDGVPAGYRTVRVAPNNSARYMRTLQQGERIFVTARIVMRNGSVWVRLTSNEGQTGYVRAERLVLTSPVPTPIHEVSRTYLNAERWMGSSNQGIPNTHRTIHASPNHSSSSRGLLPFDARIWVTARITMSNGDAWVRFTSNNVNAQNGYIRAEHLFAYSSRTYLNAERWMGASNQGIPDSHRTIHTSPSHSSSSRGILPFDARIWVTARIVMPNGEVWVRFTSNNVGAQNGYIRAEHLFPYSSRTYLNAYRWVGSSGVPAMYRTVRVAPRDTARSMRVLQHNERIFVTARIVMTNGEVWVRLTSNYGQTGYVRAMRLTDVHP